MKGIELAAGVPLRHEFLGAFRQRLGSSGNSFYPAVRIHPELFVDLAAKQFVNGNSQFFSHDVIQCHVDRADCRHYNATHAVVIEVAIHSVPKLLDIPGALADNGIAQIADGRGDRLHSREIGSLAPSNNAFSSLHADEEPGSISANAGEQMRLDFDDL